MKKIALGACLLALVAASPAYATTDHQRVITLQKQVAAAQKKEKALQAQINALSAYTDQIFVQVDFLMSCLTTRPIRTLDVLNPYTRIDPVLGFLPITSQVLADEDPTAPINDVIIGYDMNCGVPQRTVAPIKMAYAR